MSLGQSGVATAILRQGRNFDTGKEKETIAVLGYGIQGRAQSGNLSDSGFKVIVGLRKSGKSSVSAKADGHRVMEVAEAAKNWRISFTC